MAGNPTGGGKIRLAWRVLCGLLINLLLIGSALVLVAAVAALYYRHADPDLRSQGANYAASPHGWVWGTALGIAVVGLILGLGLVLIRPKTEGPARAVEAWSLRLTLAGLTIFGLEVVVPGLLQELHRSSQLGTARQAVGGGVGGTTAGILAAVLLQIRERLGDPSKAIDALKDDASRLQKLAPRLRLAIVNVAAYVLGPLLIVMMFVGAVLLQVSPPHWSGWVWAAPLAAAAVFGLLYRYGDLTSWSLHPFYRRRLCTAFALKRVRRRNRNDEVDETDDVGVAEAREQSELVRLSKTSVVPRNGMWPMLIVCAAANVSDPGATPPGRGVTSFTFSSHAMGGPLIGGIRTKEFEDHLHEGRRRDFNLPAIIAMSGAAISPSMGKHTRGSLRFLMGLANVRLGVWVPNPRRIDVFANTRKAARANTSGFRKTAKTYLSPSLELADLGLSEDKQAEVRASATPKTHFVPRPRPIYLLKELLGKTSVNDRYLYVTDGGHYENLGLVELLRRGCTQVYCFDASGGEGQSELGDAIALARSELGVEITFEHPTELSDLEEKDGIAKRACVTGRIRYTRGGAEGGGNPVEGMIVYAPTVMTADVPLDLHAFKKSHPIFPHDSTVDQLLPTRSSRRTAYSAATQHTLPRRRWTSR